MYLVSICVGWSVMFVAALILELFALCVTCYNIWGNKGSLPNRKIVQC